MNLNIVIHAGALIGKSAVELSSLPQNKKEQWELTIDAIEVGLQLFMPIVPNKDETITNCDQIRKLAAQYSIDKVIVFPVPYKNRKDLFGIRVYGQDSDKLIRVLNLSPISNSNSHVIECVDWCEKELGIVVYEREPHT